MTYEQVFNMINDELRLASDDADFNLDHIEFLCSKWRAYILETENLNKKLLSLLGYDSPLFQQLCVDVAPANPGSVHYSCDGGAVLKSKNKIPELLTKKVKVDLINFFKGANVCYLENPDRFKYQGCNKWTKNIIYTSILPDGYLYMKSANPNFINLEKVKVTGVFLNLDDARSLLCDTDGISPCNYMEMQYPLAEYQLPALIQSVVNELLGASYRPKDIKNNANDDMHQVGNVASSNKESKENE